MTPTEKLGEIDLKMAYEMTLAAMGNAKLADVKIEDIWRTCLDGAQYILTELDIEY